MFLICPSTCPWCGTRAVFLRIDDLKYESKYKELKKKVREVEEVRNSRFDGESNSTNYANLTMGPAYDLG